MLRTYSVTRQHSKVTQEGFGLKKYKGAQDGVTQEAWAYPSREDKLFPFLNVKRTTRGLHCTEPCRNKRYLQCGGIQAAVLSVVLGIPNLFFQLC